MTWKDDVQIQSRPGQRYGRIFSGDDSEDLWKAINKVEKGKQGSQKLHWALYCLGVHCQELEQVVQSLEGRVARLEDT